MNIDWNNLGFEYMDTNCHVRYTWKNGSWNEGETVNDPHLNPAHRCNKPALWASLL